MKSKKDVRLNTNSLAWATKVKKEMDAFSCLAWCSLWQQPIASVRASAPEQIAPDAMDNYRQPLVVGQYRLPGQETKEMKEAKAWLMETEEAAIPIAGNRFRAIYNNNQTGQVFLD